MKKIGLLTKSIVFAQCIMALLFSLSHAEDVTFTVGKGSAVPGSTHVLVDVSLENQNAKVKAIQVDICDHDNYLICNGCETTDRTDGFFCSGIEQPDGCCRIALIDFSGEELIIAEGEGSIFRLKYNVSAQAPETCVVLNIEDLNISDDMNTPLSVDPIPGGFCFPCSDDADCDDGLFCNGSETCDGETCQPGNDPCVSNEICDEQNDVCVEACEDDEDCEDSLYCNGDETCANGYCQPGTDPCPEGTVCNEETDSCDPVTTTTTTPATTTTPVTTTTPIPTCEIAISPKEATVDSKETLQFTARTTCGGEEVPGIYAWEISPASTIGSTITEDTGLFTAGENNSGAAVEETIKVTDTANGSQSITAKANVLVRKEIPLECEVRINPSSAIVSSGYTLTLSASTIGVECETGNYEWSISTEIGSTVDQEGNYTAGSNTTESDVNDIVTALDKANGDISGTATITVEGEKSPQTVTIFPTVLRRSRWIPLPYVLFIFGEGTGFDLRSRISFKPGDDIMGVGIGFGNIFLALGVVGASSEEGIVTVTITTGEEIAVGEVSIQLLPFSLEAHEISS